MRSTFSVHDMFKVAAHVCTLRTRIWSNATDCFDLDEMRDTRKVGSKVVAEEYTQVSCCEGYIDNVVDLHQTAWQMMRQESGCRHSAGVEQG